MSALLPLKGEWMTWRWQCPGNPEFFSVLRAETAATTRPSAFGATAGPKLGPSWAKARFL